MVLNLDEIFESLKLIYQTTKSTEKKKIISNLPIFDAITLNTQRRKTNDRINVNLSFFP